MSPEMIEQISSLVNTAGVLCCVFFCIRRIAAGDRFMALSFFCFGCASMLMSNFYWIAHIFMKPGIRMPFAANEFGEGALFLLLATSLKVALQQEHEGVSAWEERPAGKETAGTAVFVAASTMLWIGWSGEWVDDIMIGIMFGYYLCTATRWMKQTHALSHKEWIRLGCAAGILILIQALIFIVPGSWKTALDTFCYILMFAVMISLFLVCRKAYCSGNTRAFLSLAFGLFGWIISTLYMSAGIIYSAVLLLMGFSVWLLFFAIIKRSEEI